MTNKATKQQQPGTYERETTTLSGKKVKYHPVDISTFQERMRSTGIPESMLQKVVEFNTDIKNGQEDEILKRRGRSAAIFMVSVNPHNSQPQPSATRKDVYEHG